MENDLISRQAAIDALKKAYWDSNIQSAKNDPCIVDAMTDWAIRQVKALPSAQSEIIRCENCANWEEEWSADGKRRHYCTMIDSYSDKSFYCANAERREEPDGQTD